MWLYSALMVCIGHRYYVAETRSFDTSTQQYCRAWPRRFVGVDRRTGKIVAEGNTYDDCWRYLDIYADSQLSKFWFTIPGKWLLRDGWWLIAALVIGAAWGVYMEVRK